MHASSFLLLACCAYTVCEVASDDSQNKTNPLARYAGNYTAHYRANFGHFLDIGCTGPPPQIKVLCQSGTLGTQWETQGTLEVTRTSHPSIECGTSLSEWDTFSGVTCVSTCTDDNCRKDSYLRVGRNDTAQWGSIYFTCSGTQHWQIKGAVLYESTGSDYCNGSLEPSQSTSHMAQLGLECYTNETAREYVVDDFYSECDGNPFIGARDGWPGNQYACSLDRFCSAGAPCTLEYVDLVVNTEIRTIWDACVVKDPPDMLLPSFRRPLPNGAQQTQQFQAAFGLFSSEVGCDTEDPPTVRLTCPYGRIKLIETKSVSAECIELSDNELECSDNLLARNRFSAVIYNCTGNSHQATRVEYPSSLGFCVGNENEASVRHQVQLGIFCAANFAFLDILVDCGSADDRFDLVDEFGGPTNSEDLRYTCVDQARFPPLSNDLDLKSIPQVSIQTEPTWESGPLDECFTLLPATESSAPVPFVSTQSPVSPPTEPPAVSSRTVDDTSSEGDPSWGLISGLIVGSCILGSTLVVIFVLELRNRTFTANRGEDAPGILPQSGSDMHHSNPVNPRSNSNSSNVAVAEPVLPSFKDQTRGAPPTRDPTRGGSRDRRGERLPSFKDQTRPLPIVPCNQVSKQKNDDKL